jgi:hypothetical protein
MLPAFGTDRLEDVLSHSGIGKAVRRLHLWPAETESNRAKASRLISTRYAP